MGNPDISVVIVSYNVWDYIKPCINSLFAQKGVIAEIIVIDNKSADGTVGRMKNEFPQVKLIINNDNKGFSGANNQGIAATTGTYILLLNPDTELKQQDILFKLKQSLDNQNSDGIVVPSLSNTDGSYQPSFWPIPGIKELLLELFHFYKQGNKNKPSKPIFVESASGAALFFKKQMIDEIGMLDEDMFWMEDMDFCYRVRKAGKKILYDPSINIIHHGGKSSTNYSIVIPNQVISKIKFYKKHGSLFQFVMMDKLSFWFIISRWFVFAMASLGGSDIFTKKRKAYSVALKRYLNYARTGEDVITKGA